MPRSRVAAIVLGLTAFCARTGAALAAGEPASEFFVARGVKMHYLAAGKGEPVVLIHGLHSSAAMNWKMPGVLTELAKDHQVVALDLPGHGLSDKPDEESAYGLALVDDVAALLDHLKIKQAHIVGYSLGGMVTVKFMVDHPQRVLSGTVGGMGWLRDGSRQQRIWERLPAREGSRTPVAFIHTIGRLAVTEKEIEAIDVPVKIIVGDRDPVERFYVAPLRSVRPDWPVAEIEDAGHLNCIMKPAFRDAIVDGLRKHTKK